MAWDDLSLSDQIAAVAMARGFQPVAPALTESAKTIVTGTQTDFSVQLIGKDMPVFVGGEGLFGHRIYEGPYFYTIDGVVLCDMIVGFAAVATPTAARIINYLNLNGTTSITSPDGGATWIPVGSVFAGVEVSVLPGSETQTPFAESVARFGASAVPYRSHPLINIRKIPLDPFNNVVPFVSGFWHEAYSITRNDAIVASAKYARYDDSEIEATVSGVDKFWIWPQQTDFIGGLQQFQKILRNWNITTTDKLRVFENNSSDGIDAVLTRSNIVADSIKLTEIDPLSLPRQRWLSFINSDKDNEWDTVPATRERFPVPLTASQGSETIELPICMTTAQASALVNKSLLIDDIARTRFACTVNNTLYGIECGDIVTFDDDPSISFLGRVISTARKTADFTVDIVCEKIDYFTFNRRPVITSNGGGATATVGINEGMTVVTTVTATDANSDVLTYSIIGGADAALFTINALTGVLSFTNPPVFSAPLDVGADNSYEVVVQVSDGALVDTQSIIVIVGATDQTGSPIGLLLALTKNDAPHGSPMGLLLSIIKEI